MYAEMDFQLLEARTADVRVDMPWRRDRPYINPHALFRGKRNTPFHQQEHITAIIGKNGTGKSHLLGAIVKTFIALETAQLRNRIAVKNLPLEYMEYMCDGKHCVVEQQRREIVVRINGVVSSIFSLPLPRRVVALTISPFDKFPVPRTLSHSVVPVESSMYQYLGLRDRFGKASIETLLYRSLNSLFDSSENEALRRSNIGAVFNFLKLKPTINVIYELRANSRLRDAVNRKLHLEHDEVLSPSQQRRVEEVERGGISPLELRQLVEMAYERADERGRIETRADFEYGGSLDELFHKLQPIRRAGFLRLIGVEVTHHSGYSSDLRGASSGTLSMVSALIALASVIGNGSLVLIDEPEISLHPEWQVKYIDLLAKTFERYRGCQFVVATHSPLVISELPAHAQVTSLDGDRMQPTSMLQGQSADFLLAAAFGIPTNGNLYVRDRIVEALRLVANGEVRSSEFARIFEELQLFHTDLADDDPAKAIIANLQKVAEYAGTGARE